MKNEKDSILVFFIGSWTSNFQLPIKNPALFFIRRSMFIFFENNGCWDKTKTEIMRQRSENNISVHILLR